MNEPCLKLPCNKIFTSEGGVSHSKRKKNIGGLMVPEHGERQDHYISPSVTNPISSWHVKIEVL